MPTLVTRTKPYCFLTVFKRLIVCVIKNHLFSETWSVSVCTKSCLKYSLQGDNYWHRQLILVGFQLLISNHWNSMEITLEKTFIQLLKNPHFKLKTNLSEMLEIRFSTVVVLQGDTDICICRYRHQSSSVMSAAYISAVLKLSAPVIRSRVQQRYQFRWSQVKFSGGKISVWSLFPPENFTWDHLNWYLCCTRLLITGADSLRTALIWAALITVFMGRTADKV